MRKRASWASIRSRSSTTCEIPELRSSAIAGGLALTRLAHTGGAVLLGARRERRRHAATLALLERHDATLDAVVADDLAARRHPRIHIAAALVRLATGRVPAFALGAGGETALTRVRCMLNPKEPSIGGNAWPGSSR
ncbi:hypothetical protein ACFLIM_45200 [Nonomuraea sp. M3C6]|uniref:Uncharacterized protein n=1 Tax=Nonomuraea marmarensis TaxID=3351344 RepID=A0ABW7ASJ2_9ACTN